MEIKLEVLFQCAKCKAASERHQQQELGFEMTSNHIHDHFHSK